MRYFQWYNDHGISSDILFHHIIKTLKETNRTWDYFVNWKKVENKLNSVRVELNILNSLLGTKDFDRDFVSLIKSKPEVLKAIPVLAAIRGEEITVLGSLDGDFEQTTYDFSRKKQITDDFPKKILHFVKEVKISDLFTKGEITNLIDYTRGVEVGLDSNGRKNRGGDNMENIVDTLIKRSVVPGLRYIFKPTTASIRSVFGKNVHYDIAAKFPDYAVYNEKTDQLFLLETNFYNDGGSKLKAVCSEFEKLCDLLRRQGIIFIWVTDGPGWITDQEHLRESYDKLDYLLNIKLLEDGILDSIFYEKIQS